MALSGSATDDGKPAGVTLRTRWTAVTGPGAAAFANPLSPTTTATFDAPGTYLLRLSASDTELAASDELTVVVQGQPPSGDAPVVALSTPLDLATVTEPTDVRGSVASDSLLAWRLEYREPSLTESWRTIATGDTPVAADSLLGRFDPTLQLNGIYELRLVATDQAGRTASDTRGVVVEGNFKVGQFSLSFEDLSVPVSGIPIQVMRTYDSRDPRNGDFGFGWSLTVSSARVTESKRLGLHWQVTRGDGIVPVLLPVAVAHQGHPGDHHPGRRQGLPVRAHHR